MKNIGMPSLILIHSLCVPFILLWLFSSMELILLSSPPVAPLVPSEGNEGGLPN